MGKILAIDDSAETLTLITTMLAQARHEVRTFEDGSHGVESALREPPDLVLCDIGMENLDGFGVLAALRGNPATADMPFIFLTSSDDRADFRTAMNSGADDYLVKPVQPHELVSTVERCLARRRPRAVAANSTTTTHADARADGRTGQLSPVAGYRLTRKLGSGGMSLVYLAEPAGGGAPCVIKLVKIDEHDAEAREALDRFIQEYALLSQIRHPNIAEIRDRGFTGTHAYIVMEHLPGGDLRSVARRGTHPRQALSYLRQAATALDAIHRVGIVHRDLKPDNLMLRANGTLVLADFGIAKHLSLDLTKTRHGAVYGTPQYISPEQTLGKPADPRSDLYSLGVLFFQLLTGHLPYVADDVVGLLSLHVKAAVPRLPGALAPFQPLVDGLMDKNPARRYARARALLDVLPRFEAVAASSAGDGRAQPADGLARQGRETPGLSQR